MFGLQQSGNALHKVLGDERLRISGLMAELAGPRSIKITRNGRFLGVWRKTVVSFDWYPSGYSQAQLRVPTPELVVEYHVEAKR